MKTFAITTCLVLLFATSVFGDDQEIKMFKNNFAECAKELDVPVEPPTSAVFKCAIIKDGTIYDAQSGLKSELIISKVPLLVADSSNIDKVVSMTRKCLNDATQAGGTNDEMLTKAAECGTEIVPFFG